MAVPTGCRIVFSFTAFFSTGYTVWYVFMHSLPWLTRAVHGSTVIITAGLAVVSACSAKSHSAVLDRVTVSLLCAGTGTSPFVKFTNLNQRDKLPYAPICITLARLLALLTFTISGVLLKGYNTETLSSLLLLSVAFQYASLSIIMLFQYRRAKKEPHSLSMRVVQQLHSWLIALGSFVCSTLGFSFQDMEPINWSLWVLLLLVLLPENLLLAYEVIIKNVHGGLKRMVSPLESTSSRGALVQLPDDSKELGSLGRQNAPEDQAHATDSPPISASDIDHNAHESEDSVGNDTQRRPAEAAFGLSTGPVDRIKTTLHEQTPGSLGAERGNPDND